MNKEEIINPLELDALCEHLDNVNCQLRKKISDLQQENKELKGIINKIKELMDEDQCVEYCYADVADYLLELEKGESNE